MYICVYISIYIYIYTDIYYRYYISTEMIEFDWCGSEPYTN